MANLGTIGDLIDVTYLSPGASISGVVTDSAGSPARRIVRAYDRVTGGLVRSVMSSAETGAYTLTTTVSNEGNPHQVVFLDDDAGTQYNDLILAGVLPG